MATVQSVLGDILVSGTVIQSVLTIPNSVTGTIPRANITTKVGGVYDLPLPDWRVSDTNMSLLAAAGSGKLGLVCNTPGATAPQLVTTDCKANATLATFVALTSFTLPDEYPTGGAVNVLVTGGCLTTVADDTATVDIEAWEDAGDGTVGADIASPAAQSIKSMTHATKTFVLNPAGLVAGDKIHIRLTVSVKDNATGAAVYGAVDKVSVLVDKQG
jgi:hypothetical protein